MILRTEVKGTGMITLFMKSGAKIEISNNSLIDSEINYYEKLFTDMVFSVGGFLFNGKDIEVISY